MGPEGSVPMIAHPKALEAGDDHANGRLIGTIEKNFVSQQFAFETGLDCCCKGVQSGERGFGGIDPVIY